ncbi:hypothetical protein XAC3962 [Xanthomonas citri pv. citri str. 306]|uniref:Uncharacterized protein n=1 Tax=Xanthomonas axonopodis pv. citri (strain 306) TaxID=190486 RepID=A0AAI7ZIK9_XANAC|nr:hypothetical protein XAC3962 [Xanthomonas citri pv. citri str. 306]
MSDLASPGDMRARSTRDEVSSRLPSAHRPLCEAKLARSTDARRLAQCSACGTSAKHLTAPFSPSDGSIAGDGFRSLRKPRGSTQHERVQCVAWAWVTRHTGQQHAA